LTEVKSINQQATQTHKKPWLHRTKTKKTKAQDRKVTATQTPQKTLVTQDEDNEDKSTRQKSKRVLIGSIKINNWGEQ
jgi:hypothetical protein